MQIVPRRNTPIALTRLPSLIDAGFRAANHPISATQRANLAVIAAVETAGGRSAQNFNIGNITANELYSGRAWRPPWFDPNEASGNERYERLHDEMLAGRAPRAFRAYTSELEGATDFARVLVRSFPRVLAAADSRDAERLRWALAQKYSTDYDRPGVVDAIRKYQRAFGIEASTGAGAVLLLLLAAWLLSRRKA